MIATAVRDARRIHVTGLVQGVGFRPFVHRLALRHELGGWIRNCSGEVQIEIEGAAARVDEFLRDLVAQAPPLARIEAVNVARHPPHGLTAFAVVESVDQPGRRQPVSPDAAMCEACERELLDPGNRRYRYPFITCTDCGPRFTVIRAMPYDRQRTSMSVFTQCADCLAEYHTPGDRRYHSESNSCPSCGPRLEFRLAADDAAPRRGDPDLAIDRAAALLEGGGILALRGLGGFHLAVDATSEEAVARLRARKRREAKPFAVMVPDLDAAGAIACVGAPEAAVLSGGERPIVLVERKPGARLAPSVAPGLGSIGVMLPYTPLHRLLLDRVGRVLVMTSGNLSDEPIATGNDEAIDRLASVADGFLLHDRDIVARYDDSVVRLAGARPVFLRRARGYAPAPIGLPVASPAPLLAVGAHLKNTFCLAQDGHAFVSQHIGDLETLETLTHFDAALASFRRLFRVEPSVVAHDRHPGYLSTRVAEELGLPAMPVQHHHAHIAAVLAEHGETGPALGVAFDGTGLGDDGTTWGAEILLADLCQFRRVGHFRAAPLPGGDLAARRPWRAALGFLSLEPGAAPYFAAAFEGVSERERAAAAAQIGQRLNAPLASSMGRLFDAAAAVLGVRRVASYEGQAAMELEGLAGHRPGREYACEVQERDGVFVAEPVPVLAALGARHRRGVNRADLAADFHATIARTTEELVRRASRAHAVSTVALGGGCFQNARLLVSLEARLTALGLRVLVPRRLSPNDGAISYGQAAVAAARLADGFVAEGG